MTSKRFTPGQEVEILPNPMGYRGARSADAHPDDWKPAVYVVAGSLGMRGWHSVDYAGRRDWIPTRRIRARKAAP